MSEEQFLAVAVEAAKSAGEIIRKGFYQTKNVEHKGQVDLVTETDKACENLVFDHLRKHFPDHKFIGEETSAALGATADLTDEPTWIVDPLDGTTNFVHGFPFVCVSIGLTIGKIPTVGVVFNPIMNELFTAVRGKGAFLNGSPIKASSQDELVKALLVTEVGTKRDKATLDDTTDRINKLLYKIRSIRMCGSLALNMCGVACGRLDLCYEMGFGGPWDVAAGAVILQEAGGLVFDPSGGEFDLMSRRMAGSNSLLKDKFVKELGGPATMALRSNTSVQKTLYEVLSLSEDATYDEIRAAYRSAALNTHPDKAQTTLESSVPSSEQQEFFSVQKAWEILRHPTSRADYDKQLQSSRQNIEIIASEIEVGDMIIESTADTLELLYTCRCGDYFSITSCELSGMGIFVSGDGEVELQGSDSASASIVLGCGSCSLKTRLVINETP